MASSSSAGSFPALPSTTSTGSSSFSDAWSAYGPPVEKALKEWPTWIMRKLKVAAHYGFVPLVIAIGMSYEPRPHILQLIGP